MEVLLEVVFEREVDERRARGDELHRGAQPALDDRQVASGQVAVQLVHVAADLQACAEGGGRLSGSIRGPAITTIRNSGMSRLASGKLAITRCSSGVADPRAAYGHDADPLTRVGSRARRAAPWRSETSAGSNPVTYPEKL